MLPILPFEVTWKVPWVAAVALPPLIATAIAAVIPWGYAWRHYARSPRTTGVGEASLPQPKGRIMKGFIYEKYGPPEVLRMADVDKPAPNADEVLVRVLAVSVNPADWHSMRGKPLFSRL